MSTEGSSSPGHEGAGSEGDPPTAHVRRKVHQPTAAESAEVARARYGVTVVLAGLVVTLVAFGLTLLAFDKAGSVSAALAPITGVIGTIVGAYFGVQVGASGKAESEAARSKAEDDAKKLAAVAPSGPAMAALGAEPVSPRRAPPATGS
jgi:hypothetical protein